MASVQPKAGNVVKRGETKVQQLSKGLFLHTTDHMHADGKNVVAVEFELEVKKDRSVVFEMDFTGSMNMTLELAKSTGGNEDGLVINSRSSSPVNKDLLMKSKVLVEPYTCGLIGILQVDNIKSKWSLKSQYSWTEKETRIKNISQYLVLKTIDHWIQRGTVVSAIQYILKVSENKRVTFDIDFSKSTNLELSTGGLKNKTVVAPFQEMEVALLQITNAKKAWAIECKYEWAEEDPEQMAPGKPEQKEISAGIRLVTTRLAQGCFKYEVLCAKYAEVHFTLDVTASHNMALENGGGVTKYTKIKEWDREVVGIVSAVDPTLPWKLNIRFEWSENDPQNYIGPGPSHVLSDVQSGGGIQEPSHLLPHHRNVTANEDANSRHHNQAPNVRLDINRPQPLHLNHNHQELHDALQFHQNDQQQLNNNINNINNNDVSSSAETPILEEIGEGLYLQTTISDSPTPRIVYTLQVGRPNIRVTFHMSFEGSQNLVLLQGGLVCRTDVNAGAAVLVAMLIIEDPDRDYLLNLHYGWDEVPLIVDAAGGLVPDYSRTVSVRQPPPPLYIEPHNHAHVLHGQYNNAGATAAAGGSGATQQHQDQPRNQHHNQHFQQPEPSLPYSSGEFSRHGGHGHTYISPPQTPPNMLRHGAGRPGTPPMHYRSPVGSPTSSMRAQHINSQQRNFDYSHAHHQQQQQHKHHGRLPPFPFNSIAALLTHLGMPQYIATFEREDIGLALLFDMAENERELKRALKDLGILRLGQREKIAIMFRPYVQHRNAAADANTDEEETF